MDAAGVTAAALASVAGDRARVLLGLDAAWPGAHAAGPAFTVQGAPADNLALHHAIAQAPPGSVLVLAVGGHRETAHCGDIVATAAKQRGVAGIVLDGAIRDRAAFEALGLPVFHLGTSPRKPGKAGPGAIGGPVELCGVRFETGDLVAADLDGVVAVPAAAAEELLAAVAVLEENEQLQLEQIGAGRSTVEISGLDPL